MKLGKITECLEVDKGMAITPSSDMQVTGGLYACFLATSKVRVQAQSASYFTFKGPWIPLLFVFWGDRVSQHCLPALAPLSNSLVWNYFLSHHLGSFYTFFTREDPNVLKPACSSARTSWNLGLPKRPIQNI